MSDTAPPPGQGLIALRTRLFFLSFLLYFWKPVLQVDDGAPTKVPWGRSTIPVDAGHHRLRCYVSYPYSTTLGDSTTEVDVAAGETVHMQWHSPYLNFARGRWKQIR
ncbi:MAG TPA: hypothetical protein VF288_05260 [Mycobacteriales bacterium]